ncbi:MAG: DegT/DnrJ/EryC1/StrS family aminotransferase, partial [Bacteroidota bacterium]
MKNKIFVTQPSLPDLEEFIPYLQEIWESKWLTNKGKFHEQFEAELAEYLGVKHVSLFANGTLALLTALQTLRITGEVITTPYSFVATTHTLKWNGITPVFVDVEPNYYNLNPELIEAAITPQTTAIMPVHVYGNPADVYNIQEIADIYNLRIIYDAAHAFGVRINGQSICNFGDISVLSFHATKPFNTMEGGAIICHDEKTKKRIDFLKNFGFANETTVVTHGINAKMNEMQAALGIAQLKHINKNISQRKKIADLYKEKIQDIEGVSFLPSFPGLTYNYPYFPIFIDESKYGMSRDELYEKLKQHGIYGRRYFYPLISHFPPYRGLSSANPKNLPVAEKITTQVICLPIYPDLSLEKAD